MLIAYLSSSVNLAVDHGGHVPGPHWPVVNFIPATAVGGEPCHKG